MTYQQSGDLSHRQSGDLSHHLNPQSSIDLTERLQQINSSTILATLAGVRRIIHASDARKYLFDARYVLPKIIAAIKFCPDMQDFKNLVPTRFIDANAAAASAYYWGISQAKRRYFREDWASTSGGIMADVTIYAHMDVINAILEIDLEMFPKGNPLHVWRSDNTWIEDMVTMLVSCRHLEAAKHLIQLGAKPNIEALNKSMWNDDVTITKYLLDLDVIDMFTPCGNYVDALACAALAGNLEAFIMLLRKQHIRSRFGKQFNFSEALRCAAMKGHTLIVAYILNPDIFKQHDLDFVPAMVTATKTGHHVLADHIIERALKTYGRSRIRHQIVTRYGDSYISKNPILKNLLYRVK